MHLTRLQINALPGIEPGFEFEPVGGGVNIVTGPNASGKSSLVRALAHLLQPQKSDPPALSLEAEFESNGINWQVRRNGGQVLWTRNGENADPPALPAGGQLGMYRLGMEHLLVEGEDDQSLAQELLHQLHGGFDLNVLRIDLRNRFAAHEQTALRTARTNRQGIERKYADLLQQEAELPALEAGIAAAETAQRRCEWLEKAIRLHEAIRDRKAMEDALEGFPPDMDQLHGNEVGQLEGFETQWQEQRDQLRTHQGTLATHQAELERTGLQESRPKPEEIDANKARLQHISEKSIEREHAEQNLTVAEETVRGAIAQFNDQELAPALNVESIIRSEEIAGPLIAANARRSELEQQLALAGEPPDGLEVQRCRQGVEALRQWLATVSDRPDQSQEKGAWRDALPLWIALGAAAFTALAAYLQNAFAALAGAIAAIAAAAWALRDRRETKGSSPDEEARRSFTDTNLDPPAEWIHARVRERLLEIEGRLNDLLLRQKRAANADVIRDQLQKAEQELAELNERKETFAQEVGFDPELPATAFDRFVRLSVEWDKARQQSAQHKAEIERLDSEITETAKQVGEFIIRWRNGGNFEFFTPDGRVDKDALTSAFNALQVRIDAANSAQGNIEITQRSIDAAQEQIALTKENINGLFRGAGLALDDPATPANEGGGADEWAAAKPELVHRTGRLEDWQSAKTQLIEHRTTENNIRRSLRHHPDLDRPVRANVTHQLEAERQYLAQCLRRVRTGTILLLQQERQTETNRAAALESLREQRTEITTTLNHAGQDRALELAMNHELKAQADLEDKRDEAFLSEATNLLLDNVQRAFQTEHEPQVLQRARELFREVTSRAFDFELNDNGQFIARDLKQEAPRSLAELSSGTRMQLLLALRLAWMQTQEQGVLSLPLFLDEALTTSDESRFKVMAQSLERLSEAEGRQIFYLSARRHEPALWRQATGSEPAMIDLAEIRFGAGGAAAQDYEVESPPPIPAPNGQTSEAYAILLSVPQYDPRTPAGGIHLFHLLRDDLKLLHRLMETWRINSLGQLENLLQSSAAQGAIADASHRQRLQRRCAAARRWTELWRQGRGKPVDRPALEQSGAVSKRFIDETTNLAAELAGNGQALADALRDRRLPHFLINNTNNLEQWLIDNGYIDLREPLSADERRRLTLQRANPESDTQAQDIHQLIDWLEAALNELAQ